MLLLYAIDSVLRHSALSDFLGNLHSVLGHYRLGNSLRPSLDNPKNSSQILECPASLV
ncbi:hypothetical protein [uncultured Helicobacter sp.]|uniref:hypothetical protein n=1 Tax=uncultured Helicobacter sp. TaxID=175537 RepID=UPI00374E22FA